MQKCGSVSDEGAYIAAFLTTLLFNFPILYIKSKTL